MERATKIYKDLIFPHGISNTQTPEFSFEKAMLDGSPDCIKVISIDGRLLTMNRAGCLALGVPENTGFGMPWLSLLPDTIRAAGQEAIEEARQSRSARFTGVSERAGETRYWDNLLTPIADDDGNVQVILCVSRDVTIKTLLERELENALKREKLLAQEMRHRIKNVFAVVSGLVSLSEREAAESASTEATTLSLFREKLASFARASDVVFEPSDVGSVDSDRIEVALLVHSILRPYAEKYQSEGERCTLSRANVTPAVLFLHELATNSVKYGAFRAAEGKVKVIWNVGGTDLLLVWVESGGSPVHETPRHKGFGTEMVDRIARSVGGEVTKEWTSEGLAASLRLPTS